MRPKKTRRVHCEPGERCFSPKCRTGKKLTSVVLTLDEFEALRLSDLEGLDQVEAAKNMNVHRSTVSRILAAGRKKIADALTNLKAIRVEGGCCEVLIGQKRCRR